MKTTKERCDFHRKKLEIASAIACLDLLPAAKRQAAKGKPALINAILQFAREREQAVVQQLG